MGDMSELFKDMDADYKARREAVAKENIRLMKQFDMRFHETQPGVWRWSSNQGTVIYWPSSNKWSLRGKIHRGSIEQLKNWMQERGFIK